MNEKDFHYLSEEIKENFGLKPPNPERKETVEDRVIKRCENVQNFCKLALKQLSHEGENKTSIKKEKVIQREKICGLGALPGTKPLKICNQKNLTKDANELYKDYDSEKKKARELHSLKSQKKVEVKVKEKAKAKAEAEAEVETEIKIEITRRGNSKQKKYYIYSIFFI